MSLYLFEKILNYGIKDIYNNLTEKLLIKYKLNNLVKRYFASHYEYVKYVYCEQEIYPWMFKLGPRNYIEDDDIVRSAIEFIIKKYNINLLDVYDGSIKRNVFTDNKLDSILIKRFGNSMKSYFEWYYNSFTKEKFYLSKSNYKVPNYYSEDRCITLIKNYLLSLGFDENNTSEENKLIIVNNFNRDTLFKTTFGGIYKVLGKTNYEIFKRIYPSYPIFKWDFFVSKNYWNIKENRISALKELIQYTKIKFSDFPLFFTYDNLKTTRYSKFNGVCSTYYSSDYFNWINECYPNCFTYKDFHPTVILHDGYKMLSKIETNIHDFLKSKFHKVDYIERTKNGTSFYNKKYKEKYIPDWIVDDVVIVEYFGWYTDNADNPVFKKYTEKADRKTEYYNNLIDYIFIPIYPKDKHSLEEWYLKIRHKLAR